MTLVKKENKVAEKFVKYLKASELEFGKAYRCFDRSSDSDVQNICICVSNRKLEEYVFFPFGLTAGFPQQCSFQSALEYYDFLPTTLIIEERSEGLLRK